MEDLRLNYSKLQIINKLRKIKKDLQFENKPFSPENYNEFVISRYSYIGIDVNDFHEMNELKLFYNLFAEKSYKLQTFSVSKIYDSIIHDLKNNKHFTKLKDINNDDLLFSVVIGYSGKDIKYKCPECGKLIAEPMPNRYLDIMGIENHIHEKCYYKELLRRYNTDEKFHNLMNKYNNTLSSYIDNYSSYRCKNKKMNGIGRRSYTQFVKCNIPKIVQDSDIKSFFLISE